MDKCNLKPEELFESVPEDLLPYFESVNYVWELLPKIEGMIQEIISKGDERFFKLKDDVLMGKNVTIAPTASITGPAIIEDDVEIRPGAYIRGDVYIGKGCVIGNSTELKNCILLPRAQVPHYNYVGDSILGNCVHMGAGAICSNLRSDGESVIVHAGKDYETGLRKFGAVLGDHAEIGCGSVLNPGTIIGKNTQVYPLTMTRGAYPADAIVKATNIVINKK